MSCGYIGRVIIVGGQTAAMDIVRFFTRAREDGATNVTGIVALDDAFIHRESVSTFNPAELIKALKEEAFKLPPPRSLPPIERPKRQMHLGPVRVAGMDIRRMIPRRV